MSEKTSPPPVYAETYSLQPISNQYPPPPTPGPHVAVCITNNDRGEKCPQCNEFNTMTYSDVISTRQHLWAVCLCLTCCLCAWIPYVSNDCMFHRGRCKKCGYVTKDTTNNTGLKVLIGVIICLSIICAIVIVVVVVRNGQNVNEFGKMHKEWNDNFGSRHGPHSGFH